ncbi:unnamed protein product [Brassica rapa subsp. narinosa]
MTSEGLFGISIDSHNLSFLHIGEKNNFGQETSKPSSSPDSNNDS